MLQHVEDLKALPEQEQRDEHEPVVRIKFPVGTENPRHAAEEQHGREREQQRKPVELVLGGAAGGFLLGGRGGQPALGGGFFRFAFRAQVEAPHQGGQAEDEREIGDIVDQAVRQDLRAGSAICGDDCDEEQIPEPRAVGHDERAERGAFEPVLQ